MMKGCFVVFILLFVYVNTLHVRIPAANKTVLDQLYSVGITVGEQGDVWWDVYLENYKLDLLSGITTYENIVAKKAVPDMTGYNYTTSFGLSSFLYKLSTTYPLIARTNFIGHSAMGKAIPVVILTFKNTTNIDKKKIKLVSNLNGDETLGREMLIRLASYITFNNQTTEIHDLLTNNEIHIIPSLNPDGYDMHTKTNARGVDLNCNFADSVFNQITHLQPEVNAIKAWSLKHQFDLAAQIKSDGLVVMYPPFNSNVPTADDMFFKNISNTYSMYNNDIKTNAIYTDGIVRGSLYATTYGSMQDWDYNVVKTKSVLINISTDKHPNGNTLGMYWEKNRDSFIKFLQSINLF